MKVIVFIIVFLILSCKGTKNISSQQNYNSNVKGIIYTEQFEENGNFTTMKTYIDSSFFSNTSQMSKECKLLNIYSTLSDSSLFNIYVRNNKMSKFCDYEMNPEQLLAFAFYKDSIKQFRAHGYVDSFSYLAEYRYLSDIQLDFYIQVSVKRGDNYKILYSYNYRAQVINVNNNYEYLIRCKSTRGKNRIDITTPKNAKKRYFPVLYNTRCY